MKELEVLASKLERVLSEFDNPLIYDDVLRELMWALVSIISNNEELDHVITAIDNLGINVNSYLFKTIVLKYVLESSRIDILKELIERGIALEFVAQEDGFENTIYTEEEIAYFKNVEHMIKQNNKQKLVVK